VRDAGNLLTRAGLALPAVDVDSFQMRYPSAADLVEHLRVGGCAAARGLAAGCLVLLMLALASGCWLAVPPVVLAVTAPAALPPCRPANAQSMAESNALAARRAVLRRDTALAAAALYQAMFAEPDGSVPASFQVGGACACCALPAALGLRVQQPSSPLQHVVPSLLCRGNRPAEQPPAPPPTPRRSCT
jgi:NADH dehydrogenase [ubiquinone] 1 alpha subcomplex assembly factor 5